MKFLLILLFSMNYSQNLEFTIDSKIYFEKELIENILYNSKTGVYQEANFDRYTFIDTLNLKKEVFTANIYLNPKQRKKIDSLFYKSSLCKNRAILNSMGQTSYSDTNINFYYKNKRINNNAEKMNAFELEKFRIILNEILNCVRNSDEYKKVFFWKYEKK
ncbi:hypothetical protein MTP09_08065 [Chryseobacterium suipulveris]|uniref:Uncharacterized protein n=1 Tax=Chryseobacterium suipulveris TaxID=2929800 RepID=A0ABY4BQ20_9FLAO|nr:hypothetical protein [Chryseobacterium suipulveris]UOE39881.1 hypothetical protein MTP09_08065 [Chryseobacterium suipulveris]